MIYTNQELAQFVVWFIEEGYSYANFKRRFAMMLMLLNLKFQQLKRLKIGEIFFFLV